jgi:hypothetical protein
MNTTAKPRGRSRWQTRFAAALLGAMPLLHAPGALAEFNLNWQADSANPAFPRSFLFEDEQGNIIPLTDAVVHDHTGETVIIEGQSPFVYEKVREGNVNYYHMIVGDPDSGFAQETYIRAGVNPFSVFMTFGQCTGPGTCDEGTATLPIGSDFSASAGRGSDNDPLNFESNAMQPLNPNFALSGNMTANPNRVQMRQLLVDGDMTLDFVKNRYADKPSLSNTIENAEFRSVFSVDSTGNPYTSSATPSAVTNTVEHLGQDLPPDVRPPGGGPSSASFDMSTDSDNSVVTAGRYTWAPGTGPDGSLGTYSYVGGSGPNPNTNWSSFFDHREDNPWSYPDNRPTP